jgi:hypothetical protein
MNRVISNEYFRSLTRRADCRKEHEHMANANTNGRKKTGRLSWHLVSEKVIFMCNDEDSSIHFSIF